MGKKVDFFQKIFTEDIVVKNFSKFYTVRKLGVWVSGGADSAFCLWYMAKCINENELWDFEIIPMHGHDTARVADSRIAANAVVDYVKKSFPKVKIHDNYIFQYYKVKGTHDKGKYHDPIKYNLKKNETIHITINAYTSNPPKQDISASKAEAIGANDIAKSSPKSARIRLTNITILYISKQ